jgi:hypothetical protein
MNNTHKAVLIPTDVKRADTIMFPRKSQKPTEKQDSELLQQRKTSSGEKHNQIFFMS